MRIVATTSAVAAIMAKIMSRQPRWPSMREQERKAAVADDLPCGAAEDHLPPRRMAIAAHHQKVGAMVASRFEKEFAGAEAGDEVDHMGGRADTVPSQILGEVPRARLLALAAGQEEVNLFRLREKGHGGGDGASGLQRVVPCDGDDLADRQGGSHRRDQNGSAAAEQGFFQRVAVRPVGNASRLAEHDEVKDPGAPWNEGGGV